MGNSSQSFDTLKLSMRAERERRAKNITKEDIALRTGLNKNTVVRFFSGKGSNMETIYKICGVLDVNPFELLEEELKPERDYAQIPRDKNAAQRNIDKICSEIDYHNSDYVRRSERKKIISKVGWATSELKHRLPGGLMNAAVIHIYKMDEVRCHSGEELLFCLTGTVKVKLGKKEFILEKGDALFFWGVEKHQIINHRDDYDKNTNKPPSVVLTVWNDPDADLEEIFRTNLINSN